LAAACDLKEKLLTGYEADGRTFKVHLDGYNQLPYLTGQEPRSARKEFFYFNDDGDLVCLRYENWKIVFMEQRAPGTLEVWAEPFTPLRVAKFFDLRADPYERADVTSNTYWDWLFDHAYIMYGAQAGAAKFSKRSRSFRRASGRPRSRSTRRWRSCRRASAPTDKHRKTLAGGPAGRRRLLEDQRGPMT
jgi:hypothetical protein